MTLFKNLMPIPWLKKSRGVNIPAAVIFSLVIGAASVAFGAGGDVVWQQGAPQAAKQEALASVVDSEGYVIVTGYTNAGGGNDDYYTAKFKPDGSGPLWTAAPYDRAGGSDVSTAIAIDSDGNVIVTGYSWNGNSYDIHTIKYDGSSGGIFWQHTFNGTASGADYGTAVTVDSLDNVYVAGYSINSDGNDDVVVIKFRPESNDPLWKIVYDAGTGTDDRAVAIAAGVGGVAVTGYTLNESHFDIMTVKFTYGGTKIWQTTKSSTGTVDDRGIAVKMDADGNVVVAGYLSNIADHDIYLVKYAAADGAVLWDYPFAGEADAEPKALFIDSGGDIFVTGYAWRASGNFEIYTARFLADGTKQWEDIYNSNNGDDDIGVAVVTDDGGNVYVTGSSFKQSNATYDFRAIKYSRSGTRLWAVPYNLAVNKNEQAVGIGVAPDGGIYVIGYADMWTGNATDVDFYVVKLNPGALNPPTNLETAVVANDAVDLSWDDNSSNEDGFSIERKTGDGGTFEEIGTVGADVAVFSDSGLTASTRYYYRVRAYNAANGNSHFSNEAGAYTLVVTPLAPEWTFLFDAGQSDVDYATGVSVGPDNHPVVTGYTYSQVDGVGPLSWNFYTLKFDRADVNNVLWQKMYDNEGNGGDVDALVLVDRSNNAFVAGSSYQFGGSESGDDSNDVYVSKYLSADGERSWQHWFGNPDLYDMATSVVLTDDDKIYVVGYGKKDLTNEDIRVLKYDLEGTLLWANPVSFDGGGNDFPVAAAADPSGNLIVTGYRVTGGTERWFTAKFNSADGTIAWSDTFAGLGVGPDQARAVAVDAAGDVYVTGWVKNGGNEDFYTIKYNGADGTIAWQMPHNGPGNGNDRAMALKIDPIDSTIMVAGHVYVGPGDTDIHWIKYDTLGTELPLSGEIVRPGTEERVTAMGMDQSGNFHIAGTTGSGVNTDIFSVKYFYDGTLLGMTTYGAPGKTDAPSGIAVNGYGEAFVSGYATNATPDYVLYKVSSSLLQAPLPLSSTPDYSQLIVHWTDNSTTEDGYTIQRKLGGCTSSNPWVTLDTLPADTVSYTDLLLNQSTTYCYRVRAFRNDGEVSRWGAEALTTATPPMPGAFTPAVASTTQISFNWQDNTIGESGFRIERCSGLDCDFSTIDATISVDPEGTEATDTSVCKGTTYSYRIFALKEGEWESAPEIAANVVTDTPLDPTVLTVNPVSESVVDLSWVDNSSDESGFKIERCSGDGCSNFAQIGTVPAGIFTYRDTMAITGGKYLYRVRAHKTSICAWNSGYTNEATASPLIADPTGLVADVRNTTQIDLTWNDNTGAETGYLIERCEGGGCSDFATVATTGPNATTYSDTSVCKDQPHTYRVAAKKEGLSNSGGGCWTRRAPLTFTNFSADDAAKVVVPYDADMKTDFADIRFYDSDAQREIPFWVETKTDGVEATVWVKTTRGTTVHLYYGNASATATLYGGNQIFSLFDDFENLNSWTYWNNTVSVADGIVKVDTAWWNANPMLQRDFAIPPPFTVEVKYKYPSAHRNRLLLTRPDEWSPTGFDYGIFDNQFYWGGWSGIGLATDTWHILRWENTDTDYVWSAHDTAGNQVARFALGAPLAGLTRLLFMGTDGPWSDYFLDWVRIRNAGEQSAAIGAEESDACYGFGNNWTTGYAEVSASTGAVAAPGSLQATAASEVQINLTWTDDNSDESGYSVYRCTGNACGDFAKVADVPAGSTSFAATGLSPSTEYRFRVHGFKNSSCAWTTDYSYGTATTLGVPAPSDLAAEAQGTNAVKLTWTDNTGSETGFLVERCSGEGCGAFAAVGEAGTNATTFTDTTACKNTSYTYRIRGANEGLGFGSGGCWTRRVPLTITDFSPNFQTKVVITYDADMKADFSDIRFYDISDRVELPYWIEKKTDGESATVWVKTASTDDVYLYYGNASAVSTSSGTRTFDFFDDFAGPEIDASKWTVVGGTYSQVGGTFFASGGTNDWNSGMYSVPNFTRPFVLEMDHKRISGNNLMFGLKDAGGGVSYPELPYAAYAVYDYNGSRMLVYESGASRGDNLKAIVSDQWQYFKFEVNETAAVYYHGDSTDNYGAYYTSGYGYNNPMKIGFSNHNEVFHFDNVRLRKFAATEPSVTLGAEEGAGCLTFDLFWTTDYSGTATAVTADPVTPTLSAEKIKEDKVRLTWATTTESRTGFTVQRCAGAGCSGFADIKMVGNVLLYDDITAAANTDYTYRIKMTNSESCSWDSAWSNEVSVTTTPDAPAAPALSAPSTTRIDLTWNDTTGTETGFKIERCQGTGCNSFSEVGTMPVDSVGYSDTTVCSDTVYRYRVKAVNEGFSNSGGGCWTRRAALAVTDFTPFFQTKITIAYDADMQSDFRDLRFYDQHNLVELPYWLESKVDGVSAVVWIKPRGTGDAIFMYYGNASATTASNGDAVFELFDDFAGTVINPAKWTVIGSTYSANDEFIASGGSGGWDTGIYSVKDIARPFVFEFSANVGGGGEVMFGVKDTTGNIPYPNFPYLYYLAGNAVHWYEYNGYRGYYNTFQTDVTQSFKVEVLPYFGASYYIGDTADSYVLARTTPTGDNPTMKVGFSNASKAFKFDNVRVRKYAAVQPSVVVGAEEGAGCYVIAGWNSDYSIEQEVQTPAPTVPELTLTKNSEVRVTATWTDPNSDETGYKVERCSGTGCNSFAEIGVAAAGAASFVDNTVTPQTEYTYRVRGYKTASCGWNTAYSDVKSVETAVAAPADLVATTADTTTIALSWNDLSGSETGFVIERCEGDGCNSFAAVASVQKNQRTYSDITACNTTRYSYRVKAKNDGLSRGGEGCWSRRMPVTVAGLQPEKVVKVVIPYDSDMQADFDDIRFYDDVLKRELPYWIETKDDGVSATAWFKTSYGTSIYLYYGNPSATSDSDQNGVALFFDDFNGTELNGDLWNVINSTGFSVSDGYLHGTNTTGRLATKQIFSSDLILEVKAKTTSIAANGHMMGGFYGSTGNAIGWLNHPGAAHHYNNGWVSYGVENPYDNMKYVMTIRDNTVARLQIHDLDTDNLWWDAGDIGHTFGSKPFVLGMRFDDGFPWQGYAADWDWVRITGFSTTGSLGTEEESACYVFGATWSSDYSDTATAVTTSPFPPNNLTATAITDTRIDLAWIDPGPDETGFEVERCTGDGCSNFAPLDTTGHDVTSYSDTSAAPSTIYRYRVRTGKDVACSWRTPYTNTASDKSFSGKVTDLAATKLNSFKIRLDWTDSAVDEEGYEVERKMANGLWGLVTKLPPNTTTYTQRFGLDPGKTYFFRVRPYRGADMSPYSNIDDATTDPYLPGADSCPE